MKTYIIRRVLYTIPIVFGVMLVTFMLFRVVGGDISTEIAGKTASAETIAEIRKEYGWDKPLFLNMAAYKTEGMRGIIDSQFFHHFADCITFNFGKSIRNRRKISQIILEGAGPSLSLTIPMFIISLIASLIISLIVAFHRGQKTDKILVVICVMAMSVPFLVYIIGGQYFLGYRLGLFPVFGYETGSQAPYYLALPVIIGVIAGLGGRVRFYRTVMLDEINADYVRTARAKGCSNTRVLFKHVLKNAMIPIITSVVMTIPFLFVGSLFLERFFGIPGLGYLMIEAIYSRDFPVINAMTYIGALLYVVGLVITDICYALADPRVKLK